MSKVEQLYDYVNNKSIDYYKKLDISSYPKLRDDELIIHSDELKVQFIARLQENRENEIQLTDKIMTGNESILDLFEKGKVRIGNDEIELDVKSVIDDVFVSSFISNILDNNITNMLVEQGIEYNNITLLVISQVVKLIIRGIGTNSDQFINLVK